MCNARSVGVVRDRPVTAHRRLPGRSRCRPTRATARLRLNGHSSTHCLHPAVPFDPTGGGARGAVVAHVPHAHVHASEHERCTLRLFARRLAALKGWHDGGEFDPARTAGPLYFVPARTLIREEAEALGIQGPDGLFGGVVPHPFVGSKAISHPLVAPDAAAPAGWSAEFSTRVGDAVLEGYSAFSPEDARTAGERLLGRGPVRAKPVRATGGRDQQVARDLQALHRLIDALEEQELRDHGLVLEEDLEDVTTFSIGQVQVDDLTASYCGVQKLTRGHDGQQVFGGSDLTVARGGFEALLGTPLAPDVRRAVEQARRYEEAVQACYPGFYASRRNYDILLGRDAAGRRRLAVLEQSWRAGGATGAELAALEVFRADPGCDRVRTCTVELFGDSPPPPDHATVYFRGVDREVGQLTKYAMVVRDDVDAG